MSAAQTSANVWSSCALAVPPADLFKQHGVRLDVTDVGLRWTAGDFQAMSTLSPTLVSRVGRKAGAMGLLGILSDSAERARVQAIGGLSGEVLHPDPSLAAALAAIPDPARAADAAAKYNAWLADFAASDPEHFVGVGLIPATGLDDALTALDVAQKSGLKGVTLVYPPGGPGSALDGDAVEFWRRASSGGTVVCFNAAFAGVAPDLSPRVAAGLAPPIGALFARLVFTGVTRAAPQLRLLTVNLGAGWIPHTLQNADLNYMRAAASRMVSLPDPDGLPSEYIRRMLWVTFTEDRYSVVNRDFFGEHHLLWGAPTPTDDDSWPDNEQMAHRMCEGLPEESRRRIVAINTMRLFQISGAAPFTSEEIATFRLPVVR